MKTELQKLLKKFNEAFTNYDVDFIMDCLTDDIKWTMVGESVTEGKEAVRKSFEGMKTDEPYSMTIDHIITHGKQAAVSGKMKSPDGNNSYAFCDVYELNGFKNPKIREITSFVIEEK